MKSWILIPGSTWPHVDRDTHTHGRILRRAHTRLRTGCYTRIHTDMDTHFPIYAQVQGLHNCKPTEGYLGTRDQAPATRSHSSSTHTFPWYLNGNGHHVAIRTKVQQAHRGTVMLLLTIELHGGDAIQDAVVCQVNIPPLERNHNRQAGSY